MGGIPSEDRIPPASSADLGTFPSCWAWPHRLLFFRNSQCILHFSHPRRGKAGLSAVVCQSHSLLFKDNSLKNTSVTVFDGSGFFVCVFVLPHKV